MNKIGVISDTHGLLRPEVKESLQDCDAILHAGDINQPELLDELREIAPVRAVCGNADESWAEAEGIAQVTSLNLFGLNIGMAHTKKAARSVAEDSDIIITGHTHKYEEKIADGKLWLNPGTCGPVRRSAPITLAVIETTGDGTYRIVKVDIPQSEEKKGSDKKNSSKKSSDREEAAARSAEEKAAGKNEKKSSPKKESSKKNARKKKTKNAPVTKDLIGRVVGDVNTGIPVSGIADKEEISEDLAEEIRRLYVTHQGIDAEGILQKMSL